MTIPKIMKVIMGMEIFILQEAKDMDRDTDMDVTITMFIAFQILSPLSISNRHQHIPLWMHYLQLQKPITPRLAINKLMF